MPLGPVGRIATPLPSYRDLVAVRRPDRDESLHPAELDREAWANARYAALREQRPRFETAPHRVDVYL